MQHIAENSLNNYGDQLALGSVIHGFYVIGSVELDTSHLKDLRPEENHVRVACGDTHSVVAWGNVISLALSPSLALNPSPSLALNSSPSDPPSFPSPLPSSQSTLSPSPLRWRSYSSERHAEHKFGQLAAAARVLELHLCA